MAEQFGVQVGYTYVATAVFFLGLFLTPLGCMPAFKVVTQGPASQGLLPENADTNCAQVTPHHNPH